MIAPTARNGDVWSKIELAGKKSPGTVKLSGHERVTGWDVKESAGQDGATTARKGNPIGAFTATFHLVVDESMGIDDFAEWDAFQELLESTINGAKPQALDVWHPDLARNHFKSVTLVSVGPMVPDDKGGATIAVKLQEYNPPKPKAATGASGSKSKADPNDPIAKRTAELNNLLNEGKVAPARKSGAF